MRKILYSTNPLRKNAYYQVLKLANMRFIMEMLGSFSLKIDFFLEF